MAVGQVNRKSTGGEAQVNSDWNAPSGVEEILNKPTIVSPVNSDWNAASGVEEILNKPTIVSPINSDWDASSGLAKILNKPAIPEAQVKSDWNASGTIAEILNKPTMLYANAIFTKATVLDGEFLWPYGIYCGTSTVEYNNYYPLPRGKKFIIRKLYYKLRGIPTVAGKITFTIKETGTTDNQQILTGHTWNTNAAAYISIFTLNTPWEPVGALVGLGWDGLCIKLNLIDGLTVNITDALVIAFIEYKTT